MTVPALLTGLLDDAAVFPPGNAALGEAVAAHAAHLRSAHSTMLGSFVVPVARLGELSALADVPPALSITMPASVPFEMLVHDAVPAAATVVAVEISIPAGTDVDAVVTEAADSARESAGVAVYLEIPRDGRGRDVLDALAGSGCAAKLRTGGATASAYPDEAELAALIHAAITLDVPFKATAGLHRAARNTDRDTGFEQHGFLNVLWATHLADDGGAPGAVADALAIRDGVRLADALRRLDPDAVHRLRARFRSFGTCSIAEPLADLTALALPDTGSAARP